MQDTTTDFELTPAVLERNRQLVAQTPAMIRRSNELIAQLLESADLPPTTSARADAPAHSPRGAARERTQVQTVVRSR
ncbi:hypothetical protein [Nocardia gipuzkoensis]